jgi:predicted O-methyltransferase YrrM
VSNSVIILEGFSQNILPIKNLYLDYIFIDGNHSYESVRLDLENAVKMLKPNGIIGIDDYINYMVEPDQSSISEYGVIRAVTEFLVNNHDFSVIGYAMNPVSPTIFIQRFPMV